MFRRLSVNRRYHLWHSGKTGFVVDVSQGDLGEAHCPTIGNYSGQVGVTVSVTDRLNSRHIREAGNC